MNKDGSRMSAEEPKDNAEEEKQDSEALEELAEQKEPEKPRDPAQDTIAVLAGKINIDSTKALPAYNVGVNKAYRAYTRDENRTPLIAIICQRDLVPRRNAAGVYTGIINPILAKLVMKGAVYWPPAKKELYTFIYYDNFGSPILAPDAVSALGWKQDDVMAAVVKPMVNVLQDFRDKDFVHGGIRPTNMFDSGTSGGTIKILLGDCLSAPPSFNQPVLYETIQRGMTDPIARGKGTLQDDLYALGVSLAVLMRQRDPLQGMSDQKIVQQKMVNGSYAAVTGKDRFKGEILELLRGLLHDDPTQRWTIDEVLQWMDGRRLSPKQSASAKKAPRPFVLGDEKYFVTPLMAMDLDKKVSETKKAIEDESLLTWIDRSLEDEETSNRFQKAVMDARQQSTGSGYEYCLISNVSIALDPDAPLRYRDLKLMGDGIGFAMVRAMTKKSQITPLVEIFMNSLVLNWLTAQNNNFIDVTALFQKFERCRRFLKTSKYGEGVERAVYALCSESPCLSEVVQEYFVATPDDLLRAYEDLCKRGKPPATFLDRHAVAFLYEKDPKIIEPYLYDLNTHENHRTVAANIKAMAAIQKRYNMDNMPAIAKIMAPRLQAVVKRYHDRKVQEKLKESVIEFQSSGDIKKIAGILDNAEVVKKDLTSFKKAMNEFYKIEEERQKLEMNLQDKESFGINSGREVSAIVSCVLAVIIMFGTAFMFLSDKSPF